MDTSKSYLYDLPVELLVLIFDKCDLSTIGTLSLTCKKFASVVRTDIVFRQSALNAWGSNMVNHLMRKRCKPMLSYRDRCIISKKWYESGGRLSRIARFRKCMPWMVMEKDYVFLSKGETIVQYKRGEIGNLFPEPTAQAVPCKDDIAKFSTNENEVVCAGRDGKIARLDKHNLHNIHSFVGHPSDILAVDCANDIIVTGCKESFIKIWKAKPNSTEFKGNIQLNNRILSVAIMPSNTTFIAGTPGTKAVHSLQLFDLARHTHILNFGGPQRNGAGILDIFPESHNTALTCGYDSTLRLWDTRFSEKSVAVWTEPYDRCLYCVQSDHNVTMITGTANHASFMMWDKRRTDLPVKAYYTPVMRTLDNRTPYERYYGPVRRNPGNPTAYETGPIYAIAFDASHIYITLDRSMLEYSYI